MHHPSNTDGSSVSANKVLILVLSCEEWGNCTQCVQTLKFNVLKLNENIELHVKKNEKKKSCNTSCGSLSIVFCCSSIKTPSTGTSSRVNCTIYMYKYIYLLKIFKWKCIYKLIFNNIKKKVRQLVQMVWIFLSPSYTPSLDSMEKANHLEEPKI